MCGGAGEDRLTFSVIWDMTEDGKVLNQWAGRTVIRSCAKLAYEHAQAMIEGTFNVQQPPVPLDGPHTWPQVWHFPLFERGAMKYSYGERMLQQ